MGLIMAKYYIDSHDSPINNAKRISVFYGSKEHILYSNLVLSEDIEIQFIEDVNPYIELSYPLDLKVVFSLKENILHFIIIGESDKQNTILTKAANVRYPLLPSLTSIKISRITEDEYKGQLWQKFLR